MINIKKKAWVIIKDNAEIFCEGTSTISPYFTDYENLMDEDKVIMYSSEIDAIMSFNKTYSDVYDGENLYDAKTMLNSSLKFKKYID